MKSIKKYLDAIYIILILVLSLLIIRPYFHLGYFPTHDGLWAVIRTSEMYREIKDFQIPPRMSTYLNFGYGYPLFNFDYPLPYYLALFFHFFKLSFINSTKLVFALTVPVSMIFIYLLSLKIFKNKTGAFLTAVFYGFYPYRLVDLYVRGSIGESLAFSIFPILFFLSFKIKEVPKNRIYSVMFGFFLAFLILAHNIMAVLFLPIIFITCLILYFENKDFNLLISYLTGFILGIGLAFYFFAPALIEKNLIRLSIIPIANRNLYYANLKQLVFPSWGYGIPGNKDSFSYQIGFPQLIIFLMGNLMLIYIFIKKSFRSIKNFNLIIFLYFYSIFIIFLQFKFSSLFWENTPLFKEINYPWTYLAPLGFLLSLISGFVYFNANKLIKLMIIITALITIIYYLPFAKPQYYLNFPDSYYFTNNATTTSSSEIMPLWVKILPFQMPNSKAVILKGKGRIKNIFYNSKIIKFNVNIVSKNGTVRINQIYYPGWEIFSNGKREQFNYKNLHGVMDIKLKKGNYFIKSEFEETFFRLIADLISFISFVIAILIVIFYFKKNRDDCKVKF